MFNLIRNVNSKYTSMKLVLETLQSLLMTR